MTVEELAKRIARKVFERRGNHTEIHISESALATLIEESIKFYERTKAGK